MTLLKLRQQHYCQGYRHCLRDAMVTRSTRTGARDNGVYNVYTVTVSAWLLGTRLVIRNAPVTGHIKPRSIAAMATKS